MDWTLDKNKIKCKTAKTQRELMLKIEKKYGSLNKAGDDLGVAHVQLYRYKSGKNLMNLNMYLFLKNCV